MYPETMPLQAGRSLDGVILPGLQSSAAELKPKIRNRRFLFWKVFVACLTFTIFALANPAQSADGGTFAPAAILQVINQDRAAHGLRPLRLNVSLTNAARNKAEDMLAKNYFAHTAPDGARPWDFIKHEKISYDFAGENLARGYTSAYELQADLLASPSHRENLLSPIFSEIGIAAIAGELNGEKSVITVQMFAAPAGRVTINN